jgi:hypothetical protein
MERRERSYRGISVRAAIGYLENLGGERVDDGTVEGDRWRVSLSSEKVNAAGSIRLTEVTAAFEGDPEVLNDVIERFSRKAIRAGG